MGWVIATALLFLVLAVGVFLISDQIAKAEVLAREMIKNNPELIKKM